MKFRFIFIFILQIVLTFGLHTLPQVYGLTKVTDYITAYDESENIFKDWMGYRETGNRSAGSGQDFTKESRIIPFPFALEYEDHRSFIDEKKFLYDSKTPIVKLSGYKDQSVLFYVAQSKTLRQQDPICVTGPHLEIRKYFGKKNTGTELYQLSDENIFNFYLINEGLLEADVINEINVVYNVRQVEYYDTPDCFDSLEKVKVKTFVYGVWGLSNYDVYSYSTKKNDKKISYAHRGILRINRRVNKGSFLKQMYDYYKIAVYKSFNPFVKELEVNDDGGILYSLKDSNESVEFIFIKNTVVDNGKLVDLDLEQVCVTGPAEIYASGYYSRFKLEKFLKVKVPYIYERDDIVFMIKTQDGYRLFYGIIPESKYPQKYDNGSCE